MSSSKKGEIQRLDAAYLNVHEKGVDLQRFGGAGYIFGENHTYKVTAGEVYYGESREGCRIIVDGAARIDFPRALRSLAVRGAFCSHVRGFLKWDGEMRFEFYGGNEGKLHGDVTYRGQNKEFDASIAVYNEKISLMGVPMADGIYNLFLRAGDDVFDVEDLHQRPKGSRVYYKYRLLEYVDVDRLKKVTYYGERGTVVFDFGGVRVVEELYSDEGFIVEAGGWRRVLDGDSLGAVFNTLLEKPVILGML